MTTLATMKQSIADEIARNDLTAMIARAITSSIKHYQSHRFFFNESRDVTFDTANTQEFYDKYDNVLIPDIMEIDYVKISIDSNLWDLEYAKPERLEEFSPASGQPTSYTYYAQQLRLYPIPNDSWEMLVAGHIKVAEPCDDDEEDNPWMTYAEELIRCSAKRRLAVMVNSSGLEPTFSKDAIVLFKSEEQEALSNLKGRSAIQTGTGKIAPYF